VLGDDGAQEADGLHTVNWGVTQGDGVGRGWVLPEIDNHLHCFQRVELQIVLSTPGHQMVNLPPWVPKSCRYQVLLMVLTASVNHTLTHSIRKWSFWHTEGFFFFKIYFWAFCL